MTQAAFKQSAIPAQPALAGAAHPVTVEVVRNAIVAYSDEMANVLAKSAYNMMIYEVRDYCCGLIDTSGRMISQNRGGLPIFLADLGIAVEDGIKRYGHDGFKPGDVLVMNHGHTCGQHLNNVVVYAPCFVDGELVAFAANRAHWVDIGGMRQGFGSYATTEIYGEGLQMRSLKIYQAGERNDTLWQIINDNIRYPEASLGDLRAQIASCQVGAQRYGELVKRYGRDTVETCIATIWDQAEASARAVIEKIPDGAYEAESFLDDDGRNLGKTLRVKVKVIVKGSTITVDYSEMNPQVNSPLNSGRSGGIAAARVAFKALTSPDLDVNEGCFRPLQVDLPEGTMLSARPPAALGLWSIALPTVIDTILKALAPAVPHMIPAAHKGDMGGCSFFGFREDDGQRFILLNIFGGGWGGRPREDGESASVSICQGDVRNTPIELQEIKYPFIIEEQSLRPDSGGAGRHRGGLGLTLTYRCLQDCRANINFERTQCPPWGLHGGGEGAYNMGIVHSVEGGSKMVRKGTEIELRAGDRVTFLTAGGGGYGDPKTRARGEVARDIAEGFVTAEGAMAYGYDESLGRVMAGE
jgi:N-methylhydantoinase B